ncbi:MAG TPA: alkaline phosphatase family protein [Thermoplasmata archaeon]|nr:alkaline phosphatase family protein [Thermoplasmata archaeon]
MGRYDPHGGWEMNGGIPRARAYPPPSPARSPPPHRFTLGKKLTRALYVCLVIDLVLLAGVAVVVLGHVPGHHAATPPSSGGPGGGPTGSSGLKIQHVVVVVLENREVNEVWAVAPYQRYLQATYGNATAYYALCHGSPPNYLAMTSGRQEYCGSNVGGSVNVTNLPDVIERGGYTWAGYFESMPSACYPYSKGFYLAWHNPFISYTDIITNPVRCGDNVLPSSRFNASVANGSLPTVSFYVPNALDDCDNSSLILCDQWLQGFLSPILNSTASATQALVAHTAFFVVYDEGDTDAGFASSIVTPYCLNATGKALSVCGGHIYLTVVSPYSLKTTYTSHASSYDLVSTIEWLFGLPSDGGYDGSADFPPMTTLFTFSSNTS